MGGPGQAEGGWGLMLCPLWSLVHVRDVDGPVSWQDPEFSPVPRSAQPFSLTLPVGPGGPSRLLQPLCSYFPCPAGRHYSAQSPGSLRG